jgi:hypothetical protein
VARRRGVLFRVWVGAVKGEWGGGREYSNDVAENVDIHA